MPDENDSADLVPGGTVERWLDDVFDGLTGTGAGGRRALVEIEDHLRAAVADEKSRGLDPAAAERAAVTRFGSPTKVARDLRAAHRNLLRPALTGVWALAGAVLLSLGLGRMVTVALTARSPGTVNLVQLGITGLVLFGLGVLMLVTLSLARRHTAMRTARWQPRRRALVAAEVLFALAGVVVLGNPVNTFGVPQFWLYPSWVQTTVGVAVSLAALAITVWLGRLRKRSMPIPA
ncbi:hypothetical protein GCM10023322_38260 [Rugosimonospora acidiphila]|uniref:DUF1129 family protein n=1 Tax=Rugosimonospora acidiphila TaxID=556531 RepID=A0ABP9RY39_9ACTN